MLIYLLMYLIANSVRNYYYQYGMSKISFPFEKHKPRFDSKEMFNSSIFFHSIYEEGKDEKSVNYEIRLGK